jgi:hypothetical protein
MPRINRRQFTSLIAGARIPLGAPLIARARLFQT